MTFLGQVNSSEGYSTAVWPGFGETREALAFLRNAAKLSCEKEVVFVSMRVIVAGSMNWTDMESLRRELRKLPADAIVIHGDCAGADALAGQIAREELGLVVVPMAKNDEDRSRYARDSWKGLNERMLAGGADLILAFHPDLGQPGKARGSGHLIELAIARGIEVKTFTE
jgi:YspA, cpYpsA-related SLOG family